MHILAIRSQHSLRCYAKAGSRFHVSIGALLLCETVLYLDGYSVALEAPLAAGTIHTVQRNGWVLLQALESSEVLFDDAVPSLPARLLGAIKRILVPRNFRVRHYPVAVPIKSLPDRVDATPN